MFGRLAMGFANVRAGTRVLMLVLVLVQAWTRKWEQQAKDRDAVCARAARDPARGSSRAFF